MRIQLSFFYLNSDPDTDPETKPLGIYADPDPDPGQTLKLQKFERLHKNILKVGNR
jgi:hypothetical protein